MDHDHLPVAPAPSIGDISSPKETDKTRQQDAALAASTDGTGSALDTYSKPLISFFDDKKNVGRFYSWTFPMPLWLPFKHDDDKIATDNAHFVVARAFDSVHAEWTKQAWCSPDEFDRGWDALPAGEQANRIVFLRGLPRTDWIFHVGSKLNLECRFFLQHLQTNSYDAGKPKNFCPVSLIQDKTIELTFTSICKYSLRNDKGDCVDEFRNKLHGIATTLVLDQSTYYKCRTCDPIVRDLQVLNRKLFTVEHKVSVKSIVNTDGSWTLLVWTDCANSLSVPEATREKIERHCFRPFSFVAPSRDLNNERIRRITDSQHRRAEAAENSQDEPRNPLAHLPDDILLTLDPKKANTDPFFVINEIFQLHTASELHFLAVVQERVAFFKDLLVDDCRRWRDKAELRQLKRLRAMVQDHSQRLHNVLEVVKRCVWRRQGVPPGEAPSSEMASTLQDAEKDLTWTYENLLHHTELVYEQCDITVAALEKCLEELARLDRQKRWWRKESRSD